MSDRTQHVYFIVDKRRRYCKIGVSHSPGWRLRDLQAGSPLPLRLDLILNFGHDRTAANAYEDALHQHFAEYWRFQEWFDFGPRLKEFVDLWKDGEAPHIPEPQHSSKQAVGDYGACLSKADYMALLRDRARG